VSDTPITEDEWIQLLGEAQMVDTYGLSSLFEDDEERFAPEDASDDAELNWQHLPDDTSDDDPPVKSGSLSGSVMGQSVMGDAADEYLGGEAGRR
jgi:hypothetical protein